MTKVNWVVPGMKVNSSNERRPRAEGGVAVENKKSKCTEAVYLPPDVK
jgi:hypothetical protein